MHINQVARANKQKVSLQKRLRRKEITLIYLNGTYKTAMNMQNGTEAKIRQDILQEIQVLEQNYQVLSAFISGSDLDPSTVGNSLQVFKDSLNRASTYVLALYNLRGQSINIPWE